MSTEDRLLSVLGGAALTLTAIRRKSGVFATLTGLEMIRRGISGHCFAYQMLGIRTKPNEPWRRVSVPYELGVKSFNSITINQPRQQVFEFWRQLGNLPKVMRHLVSVVQVDGQSHWIAEGPRGRRIEWDAQIINEVPGELLAWRSLPGSQVDSAGSVRFKEAPGDRGTEIQVELQYNPPAGFVGAAVAKLFGRDPEAEIESDLYRLKQYLEAGEIATVRGQSQGGKVAAEGDRSAAETEGIGK